MKHLSKLLIPGLIILTVFLLLPNFSFAQSKFIVCNGPDCTICDFLILVKNAITFVIELSIILASLFFAFGAFVMMTARESEEQVKKGREMMTTAVIGAAIALSSFVIVGTIMQFLSGSSSKLPWSEIECILEKTSATANSPQNKNANPSSSSGTTLTEQEARNKLTQAGIIINKNYCPVNTSYQNIAGGCTSLEGIQISTMTEVIQLKQECNCPITITGGTEEGHAAGQFSHANGYKLDFSPNPALDQYIQKNFQPAGTRSDGALQYRASDGTIMAKESDHWDATFK